MEALVWGAHNLRSVLTQPCPPLVRAQTPVGAAAVRSRERTAKRRRNRLHHQDKSCVCVGGAVGFACRARLRAIISQLLMADSLLTASVRARTSSGRGVFPPNGPQPRRRAAGADASNGLPPRPSGLRASSSSPRSRESPDWEPLQLPRTAAVEGRRARIRRHSWRNSREGFRTIRRRQATACVSFSCLPPIETRRPKRALRA